MNTSQTKNKLDLTGVPETMLAPLYNRACEQKRADRLIDDPLSLEIANSIDYDYEGNFGKPLAWYAIRSRVFDDAVKDWLKLNPAGTVVSLGEGLDTQFWRVDNGKLNWISIDLPQAIELRRSFLPENNRLKNVSCSALDFSWFDRVPNDKPIFFVLSGLVMYFTEKDGENLLLSIAKNFKQSNLIFDMIPDFYSRQDTFEKANPKKFQTPAMPWSMNFNKSSELLKIYPGFKESMKVAFFDLFPDRLGIYVLVGKVSWLKNNLSPWIIQLASNN
jgi:O-methyltransferase involved in polyketide biosynthesis